jgi:hypothetical protein
MRYTAKIGALGAAAALCAVVCILLAPAIGHAAIFEFPKSGDSLATYISKLYDVALAIGGILAVLMIVVGGIYFSVSGAVDKQAEGKEMIISALFGLLLLLGSYVLLNTINPELVKLKSPVPENVSPLLKPAAPASTACMNLLSGPNPCPVTKTSFAKPTKLPPSAMLPSCGGSGCATGWSFYSGALYVRQYWTYAWYPEKHPEDPRCVVYAYDDADGERHDQGKIGQLKGLKPC